MIRKTYICFILVFIFINISMAQKMTVEDNAGNVLMEVNDEGLVGSITLPSGSAPSTTTNKLYNVSGTLYWNGNALGTAESSPRVVFCFGGTDQSDGQYHGYTVAPTFNTSHGGNLAYWFHQSDPGDKQTLIKTKFKKTLGVSAVTWYAFIKSNSSGGNQWAAVEVDIGGQTGSAQTPSNFGLLQWVSADVDVSSLTNDVVYDVEIKLYGGDSSTVTYLVSIIGFAS